LITLFTEHQKCRVRHSPLSAVAVLHKCAEVHMCDRRLGSHTSVTFRELTCRLLHRRESSRHRLNTSAKLRRLITSGRQQRRPWNDRRLRERRRGLPGRRFPRLVRPRVRQLVFDRPKSLLINLILGSVAKLYCSLKHVNLISEIIQMAMDECLAYRSLPTHARVKSAAWPTSWWPPSGTDRLSLRWPEWTVAYGFAVDDYCIFSCFYLLHCNSVFFYYRLVGLCRPLWIRLKQCRGLPDCRFLWLICR